MRLELAVCAAVALLAGGLVVGFHPIRHRLHSALPAALHAMLAGALLGGAFWATRIAVDVATRGRGLVDALPFDLHPELFPLACLAAVLLGVRHDPLAVPWWLMGAVTAAMAACVPDLLRGAPGDASVTPALAAAVAASLILAPGRRSYLVSQARLNAILAAGDGILVVDGRGHIVDVNEAAVEALALSPEVRGARQAARLPEAIRILLEQRGDRCLRLKTRGGRFLEAWTSQSLSRGPRQGFRAVLLRDVTVQHKAEQNLLHLAHYDSLTGLVNRRFFLGALKRDLDFRQESGGLVALFYIDLDRFKEINDSLGHGAGDALLQELAERFRKGLSRSIVEAAPGGQRATIARLGGDEFAVTACLPDPAAAAAVARRIIELVAKPIELEHRTVTTSASVGIALSPKDSTNMEDLMRSADAALYFAKDRGRNRFAFYETSFDSQLHRTTRIAEYLGRAIERGELVLHYQPKVELESGTVASLEALMRWKSEELGDVGPAQFIPVAEERGLIAALGAWALDEACRQIRAWRDEGCVPVPVAVNVSSAQFLESDLQGVVTRSLRRHGVEPDLLELELTESLMFDGGEVTALALRDLRSMGVRVALDDFGTGFSSLATLNTLPLDILKMDRGFVREIHCDPSAAEVVAAVVSMARGLGLCVVAEGVDSPEQLPILRAMGCHQIQGFLYSPAVPAADVPRFLARPGSPPPPVPMEATYPAMLASSPGPQPESPRVPEPPVQSEADDALSRILVVDDGAGALGTLALRLTRLAIDTHYAQDVDEAQLLIAEEERAICAIVLPPTIDLDRAQKLRDSLDDSLPILIVGAEPDARVRSRLRRLKAVSVLWSPFDDSELVFLLKGAFAHQGRLADRREIRIPVNLDARFHAGPRREVVMLSSLSYRGAFLEMSDPPSLDTQLRLEFALPTERFRLFARVVHRQDQDPARPWWPAGVGVAFFGGDRATELRLRKLIEEKGTRYMP